MITAAGDRLIVIDDMQVDWKLPKFKKRDDLIDSSSDESDESGQQTFVQGRVVWGGSHNLVSVAPMSHPRQLLIPGSSSFVSKLAFWRKKASVVQPEQSGLLAVDEFFASIKNTAHELVIVAERAAGYERALVNAKKAGQQALVEKLEAGLNAYRMETQLVAMGLTKFVDEADIVSFYKQSKRGLRLDYVRNFARTIPEPIVEKKARADELGIFDNYVVLHFDPAAKAYSETKAEKAARKDPILFGLMKDRTQLYFVGDWIDEHCDLTLDQLAETLGKDAVKSLVEPGHPYRE